MGDGDRPRRLRGAQAEIRDAFFNHESGLFTLDCVPGAGKSVTTDRVVAQALVRRYLDGDRTPERGVLAVSFNRDEAAGIVPGVREHLNEIVTDGLVDGASSLDERDVRYLARRVRQSPFVGTIDAILSGILREIALDCGFDDVPEVGSDAVVSRVHTACYNALAANPDHAERLDRLADAYPSTEYEGGVRAMLRAALDYCRSRQLSPAGFRAYLEGVHGDVYAEGRPTGFADIAAAVERVTGESLADADVPASGDRERLVAGDQSLHDAWEDAIDDFCTALAAYRETYRAEIRTRGVVSHTDVAFIVAAYFDGELGDGGEDADASRDRVQRRYTERIESVVIDEAQDVSVIQHAALSQLVTAETRVLCAGDPRQLIYEWRHADPTLFQEAVRDDVYLGIEWSVAVHRTASTSYRCVPDVAAAIDSICEPTLSDPSQGALADRPADYPRLTAVRNATEETNVHIAAFSTPSAPPGSPAWATPDDGSGEADLLAELLASGLADGTFTDDHGDPLSITVLFRNRTRMPEYTTAFADHGLRVRNASTHLFESDAVRAVFAVLAWLADPCDRDRVAGLLDEPALGLAGLRAVFERHDWTVDAVRDTDAGALEETHREVLTDLCDLRDRRAAAQYQPATTTVEDVVETLALRADPHGNTDASPAQRVADLDALIDHVAEWDTDTSTPPRELVALATPYLTRPGDGPTRPSVHTDDVDVVFRTIHGAKGDEDDVVALADPGRSLWSHGPQTDRLVTRGSVAGLAPPTNCDVPSDIALPPFDRGLYTPDAESLARDVGLRWATSRFRPSSGAGPEAAGDKPGFVGPESLARVAGSHHAEEWRILYVALTRARDHLVVPLPRTLPFDRPRERWLDRIRDALDFHADRPGTYDPSSGTVDIEDTRGFRVGVNDVRLATTRPSHDGGAPPDAGTTPPRLDMVDSWCPRFPQPNTLYPLAADPPGYVLDHLLGRPLHTDTNDVPASLALTHETLGPDDVGTIVHQVLSQAIRRGLTDRQLRRPETHRRLFDAVLDAHDYHPGASERESLISFFANTVLEEFLSSELWTRIQTATHVAVEHPVGGLVHIDGVEFELNGRTDVLCYTPDSVHVADIKLTLTTPTETTERRYRLQNAAYARLLEKETSLRISRSVETFGVARGTYTPMWPTDIVDAQLAKFC